MRQEKADLPISFQKQYFHNINKEECIYYHSIQIAKNNKRLALQIQASSVRLQRVEIQND